MSKLFSMLTVEYNIFITVLSLILLMISIYNRIKYLCLEKASEMVAKAEAHEKLTGEQKLALCTIWINEELPKVFRNSLVRSLVKKLINFVYDNSFEYMKRYVKRKTGQDISELINISKEALEKEESTEKEKKE